jgi:hypothetical protein
MNSQNIAQKLKHKEISEWLKHVENKILFVNKAEQILNVSTKYAI